MVKTPFHTKSGKLKFNLEPLRDLVFVWPTPPPEYHGNGFIEIPEQFRDEYQDGTGILLAAGPGYWGKDDEGDDRFYPMAQQLVPGIKVQYDVTIPWHMFVVGVDGKTHKVVYCTVGDIHSILNN